MSTVVGDILDASAVLLNDSAKQIYTNAAQLPMFNLAQAELRELMELNNVPSTNSQSTAVTVTAGVTLIDFTTTPALPSDLIEIQGISERPSGNTQDYIPMTRVEFLPTFVEQADSLIWWCWANQALNFIGALLNVQLQINYVASKLPSATTSTQPVTIINANSFLTYRTAALCAEFIGENKSRADSLNEDAGPALDRFLGISAKGRQAIAVRRRPFLASFKSRGY